MQNNNLKKAAPSILFTAVAVSYGIEQPKVPRFFEVIIAGLEIRHFEKNSNSRKNSKLKGEIPELKKRT